MKLYHATHINNVEGIENNGLIANESEKVSEDERLNCESVYGFDNIEDAIDFLVWDNNVEIENVAVFSFDAVDPIEDPEYDGNAFAVNSSIKKDELKREIVED